MNGKDVVELMNRVLERSKERDEALANLAQATKQRDDAMALVARLRREKLAILADYAGVLACICEENPELTQYLDVLEGVSEQMTETVRDLKKGGE